MEVDASVSMWNIKMEEIVASGSVESECAMIGSEYLFCDLLPIEGE
jgi:hypothetical protein